MVIIVICVFFVLQNFTANTISQVISTFPTPVFARIVRINCLDSNNEVDKNFKLRFEILGCKN